MTNLNPIVDDLTPAQRKLLYEVNTKGTVLKNGRATRTVKALRAKGLVNATFDLIPTSGSHSYMEQWTVTAK